MRSAAATVIEQWLRSDRPAVIFDFNGTLSDDEPILFDIFGTLFRDHVGWTMPTEYYRDHLLGRSDREIIEHGVTVHGGGSADQVEQLLVLRQVMYQQRVAEDNPITADAVALVELLVRNDIPVGIVTGAQRGDVLAVLRTSPVGDVFEVLVAEEDVADGKPHPEGYLAGAAALQRDPADILVFEDSVPGVQAALAAGMRCIAVSAEPSAELIGVAPTVVPALSDELMAAALAAYRTRS